MAESNKNMPVAKAEKAGKTNTKKGSLVKAKVELDCGKWISPQREQKYFIDGNADFPAVTFEIETVATGPYEWSWDICWTGMACPQKIGEKRFKPGNGAIQFREKGQFKSDSKIWVVEKLKNKVIGGLLTVRVNAGSEKFIRKIIIRGKNPGKAAVDKYLDEHWHDKYDLVLIKKIFQQESRNRQFYSDEQPLVSFDNGYGIGQLTNPSATYEEAWNWKEHVNTVMNKVLPDKRAKASKYLRGGKHGTLTYTREQYDTETAAFYNGRGRFYKWNTAKKVWEEDTTTTCDPDSNRSWDKSEHPGKTADQLKKEGVHSDYTGHCYAKHIIGTQGGFSEK